MAWMDERGKREAAGQAAAELVVDLAAAGLFCPSIYLTAILGRVHRNHSPLSPYVLKNSVFLL